MEIAHLLSATHTAIPISDHKAEITHLLLATRTAIPISDKPQEHHSTVSAPERQSPRRSSGTPLGVVRSTTHTAVLEEMRHLMKLIREGLEVLHSPVHLTLQKMLAKDTVLGRRYKIGSLVLRII